MVVSQEVIRGDISNDKDITSTNGVETESCDNNITDTENNSSKEPTEVEELTRLFYNTIWKSIKSLILKSK